MIADPSSPTNGAKVRYRRAAGDAPLSDETDPINPSKQQQQQQSPKQQQKKKDTCKIVTLVILVLLLLLALGLLGWASYYMASNHTDLNDTQDETKLFQTCNDVLRTILASVSASPSPTPSPSRTVSFTGSVSKTPTSSITVSASVSGTPSTTSTKTLSASPTPSTSQSSTKTLTATPTVSDSTTNTLTSTPTNTPSNTPSKTPSISDTSTISSSTTQTPTNTPSHTSTVTQTNTRTASRTPSNTPTSTLSLTISVSNSPTPSNTPSISDTSTKSASGTPAASASNTISVSPTVSDSSTKSASQTPTATPSRSESQTRTPTRSSTPSVSASHSATPTPSGTPTKTPSGTISPTTTPVPGFVCSGPTPALTTVYAPYAGQDVHMNDGSVSQPGFRNSWCPGLSTSASDEISLTITDNCETPRSYGFPVGSLFSSCDAQNCNPHTCQAFCTSPACYDNSYCTVIPIAAVGATEVGTTIIENINTGEISESQPYIIARTGVFPCTPGGSRKRGIGGGDDDDWYQLASEVKTSPGVNVSLDGNPRYVYKNTTVVVGWAGYRQDDFVSITLVQPGVSRYRIDMPGGATSVRIYLGRTFVAETYDNYVMVQAFEPMTGYPITAVSRVFSILR